MSRHPSLDLSDIDPIELVDDDRPTRSELHVDDIEPADFDDVRIAERFGRQSRGFFAFETNNYDLTEEPF
jgi:hypothetical protein